MRHHLLVAALGGLATAGCAESQAQPGPEISRTFNVAPFSSIEVAGAYDVEVTTGRPVAVSARGTQRLVEGIVAEVKNGRLVIRPDEKRKWKESWGAGRSWAKVSVSVPSIQAAGLSGSGGVSIDRVVGERFEGGSAGSGDLRVGELRVRDLKLGVAGSGDITVGGQAESADYGVAGSGSIDAAALTAARAKAGIDGSGDIRARVTGAADASVMGSGDIEISGGARCTSSKQGSGSIRCS